MIVCEPGKECCTNIVETVNIMLREVSVMLIVDLSLASVVRNSPFQFHAFAYRYRSSAKLSFR
jgi:hypothetical protein